MLLIGIASEELEADLIFKLSAEVDDVNRLVERFLTSNFSLSACHI
ncbi:hypothetical protein [Lysinibacillus sphaericus]|nr:hypothetical protein [Lysinibacillus sphaericus]